MLKNLIKVANKLDSLGLTKEADELDAMIRRASTYTPSTGRDGWSDEGGIEEYTLEDENPGDSEQDEDEAVQRFMAVQESLERVCKEMAAMAHQGMARDENGADMKDMSGNEVSLVGYYSKACKIVMNHVKRLDGLLGELYKADNS